MDETLEDDVEETCLSKIEETATTLGDMSVCNTKGKVTHPDKGGESPLLGRQIRSRSVSKVDKVLFPFSPLMPT